MVISKKELWWIVFGAIAFVLDIVVPFAFLREGGILDGAFLFWCLLTIVVIAVGWAYMNSWLNSAKKGRRSRA